MKPFGRCFILIALCITAAAQKPQRLRTSGTDWVLRFDGIGSVRIGMTINQVNAALGERFSMPTDEDERTCFYLEPKRHSDTGIMVLNGRVARVDVFAPDAASTTATAAGIRIGDSEARVKSAYGNKVVVSPHHYTDGHYLTIKSREYALRFETDEGKVTSFYAGTLRAIAFVEGCS